MISMRRKLPIHELRFRRSLDFLGLLTSSATGESVRVSSRSKCMAAPIGFARTISETCFERHSKPVIRQRYPFKPGFLRQALKGESAELTKGRKRDCVLFGKTGNPKYPGSQKNTISSIGNMGRISRLVSRMIFNVGTTLYSRGPALRQERIYRK